MIGRTRVRLIAVAAGSLAGASHDGKVIAVEQAGRDREGDLLWAITTIDSNGQDIKHLAVVGDSAGDPAEVSSYGDNPRTAVSPSADGQRALIQTPFRHGG